MTPLGRSNSTGWRLAASGFISVLGVGMLVLSGAHLLPATGPPSGLFVAGIGSLVSLVLLLAGALLYRASFAAHQLLRIAGWATLGTVLLGVVLLLIRASGVDLPVYAAATLLSVSTFAHVLIGVRDIQRIRAEELARQREQLAVLNRLVRHNLRHLSQRLLGIGSRLPVGEGDAGREDGDEVNEIATELSKMNDMLQRSQSVINRKWTNGAVEDLSAMIPAIAADAREDFPTATVDVDIEGQHRVRGGDDLRNAIAELVENAIVHGDRDPTVRVTASTSDGTVTVEIADDGPGMPDAEREVIMREAEIDQLTHSQGLGLWYVRWVMDTYDGDIDIGSNDRGGTTVTLELPKAAA